MTERRAIDLVAPAASAPPSLGMGSAASVGIDMGAGRAPRIGIGAGGAPGAAAAATTKTTRMTMTDRRAIDLVAPAASIGIGAGGAPGVAGRGAVVAAPPMRMAMLPAGPLPVSARAMATRMTMLRVTEAVR